MSRYAARGSSFIFFVAFTLPLTLFSLTLAADFSGIILENRKAQTVADAAARAAGTAIDPNTGTFRMTKQGNAAQPDCADNCTALDLAQQTYDASLKMNIVTKPKCAESVTVKMSGEPGGAIELTVTIPYSVTNLSLLGAFIGGEYTGFMCMSSVAKTNLCGPFELDSCLYPGANQS